MRNLLVIGGEGNMSGMCADSAPDDMLGLLSALTDSSNYDKIVFFFTEQLLQPPENPEVLLPYVKQGEVAHKTLAAALSPEKLSKFSILSLEEQLDEARKHPKALHKIILRVATSTAISLLYETVFSFAGGNQVVLIFKPDPGFCSILFTMIDPSSMSRSPSHIRTRSVNLPITSGVKEWPLIFRRFKADRISVQELAQDSRVSFPFPWTSSIPVSEVIGECRNIFNGEFPISYPVEDVSKNPRALLVEGDYDGFLLAIPQPSNMKNFSITLRAGNGIKKESRTAESTGAAPSIERNWMTRKEAAEAIGKSTDTVDNYIRDGKLKASKTDREVRITRESIQKYLGSK